MRSGALNVFGGNGGDVEVDETFIGKDPDAPTGKRLAGWQERNKVLTCSSNTASPAQWVLSQ